MGAHNHNAVLATTWSDEHYEAIRRWVDGLEPVDDRLEADGYSDGSSPWSWVEVGYGEYGQKLLRGNNENRHGAEGYAL